MTRLSTTEASAIGRIDGAAMLAQVQAWVAVNSGTRNLAGLATMAALLADALAALPGDVQLVPAAPVETVSPAGVIEPLAHGDHLLLRVRPEAPLQILLTGHMDTVFAADHPFQTATWTADGTLNAPGAADMKGGIATMLAALRALESTPMAARIGYRVLINADEETGSLSSAALIAEQARGCIAALTYEPALPDGTLAGERGGTGNFSVIVHGRAAHAGRNPQDGRNALVAAADLAVRLADAAIPGLSVNPARIDGGGPNNVVPDKAILRVNFRPSTAKHIKIAQTAIDAAIEAVSAERDVRIHAHGGFNRPPKPIDPGAARLFGRVREAGADLGLDIQWRATGGVCDGNNIAACGVPVVDTMGVRGGAIHSADEFMIPDSLAERTALSLLTLMRIAERGGL